MDRHVSSTEMYTWDFLEDNVEKVRTMRVADLAKLGHISAATIVRTLKKHGYEGFSDYKSSLKNRLVYTGEGFSFEARQVIEKNREEVVRTIELLNVDELEQVVKIIHKSQNIYVMSSGPTRSASEYLATKLQFSGKSCISLEDKDYMTFHANKMRKSDLLIAVSLRGETEEIILAGKIAKKRGAKMITLTSEYDSTLARLSDYKVLCYKSKLKKFDVATDTASRISLEIISRILLDMYAIYKRVGKIRES